MVRFSSRFNFELIFIINMFPLKQDYTLKNCIVIPVKSVQLNLFSEIYMQDHPVQRSMYIYSVCTNMYMTEELNTSILNCTHRMYKQVDNYNKVDIKMYSVAVIVAKVLIK